MLNIQSLKTYSLINGMLLFDNIVAIFSSPLERKHPQDCVFRDNKLCPSISTSLAPQSQLHIQKY